MTIRTDDFFFNKLLFFVVSCAMIKALAPFIGKSHMETFRNKRPLFLVKIPSPAKVTRENKTLAKTNLHKLNDAFKIVCLVFKYQNSCELR